MSDPGPPLEVDMFGEPIKPSDFSALSARFGFPPFSVLDARSGAWRARKQAWLGLGIRGELGRGEDLLESAGLNSPTLKSREGERWKPGQNCWQNESTSVFDPVLCELAYRWWCPPDGQVLDPFAGGSVRGVVAGRLGRKYWGCDLRKEQIAENWNQAAELLPRSVAGRVEWVIGDACEHVSKAPDPDFVFTCPPYGDMERYSDDPRDLSTLEWEEFLERYAYVLRACCCALKYNRFLCLVVSDFRSKRGWYRPLVSETTNEVLRCGLHLYNSAVLVTPVGSAALRAGKHFEAGLKLERCHQNVLVFCKGCWQEAAKAAKGGAE